MCGPFALCDYRRVSPPGAGGTRPAVTGLHAIAHAATAPVRLGLTAGEIALEVALGVVRGTRRVLDGEHRDDEAGLAQRSWAPPPPPPRPAPTSVAEPAAPPPPVPPAAAEGDAIPVVPPPPGAKTVDDDPVPVGEFAEEGAEDGAGAEVHIDPPWDGYDDQTAAQIAERLADADREVAAAVSLYEGMRRGRRSVTKAADKRLRQLTAAG